MEVVVSGGSSMSEPQDKTDAIPQICPDTAWPHTHDFLLPEEWESETERDPTVQSRFKDSLSSLRTEIAGEARLTRWEIVLAVTILVILFFVVWFIVRNVLLLEIETDVHRQSLQPRLANKARFSLSYFG
jgi:hypothetical protein